MRNQDFFIQFFFIDFHNILGNGCDSSRIDRSSWSFTSFPVSSLYTYVTWNSSRERRECNKEFLRNQKATFVRSLYVIFMRLFCIYRPIEERVIRHLIEIREPAGASETHKKKRKEKKSIDRVSFTNNKENIKCASRPESGSTGHQFILPR